MPRSSVTTEQPALSHRSRLPLFVQVFRFPPGRGFLTDALFIGSFPGGFACTFPCSTFLVWKQKCGLGRDIGLSDGLREDQRAILLTLLSTILRRWKSPKTPGHPWPAVGLLSTFLPIDQTFCPLGIWKHHHLESFFSCLHFPNNTVFPPSAFLIHLRQMPHFLPENSNDKNQ